jgi:polysaccharide biosynthesis protein PslF
MKGGFVPNAYGFLSTYPPTQCGLATFSRALMRSLAESGDRVGIVRVTDTPVESRAPEVVGHLYSRARGGGEEAAAVLNTFDVAIIQHKYGIYGGHHGDQLVSVLDHVRVPKVVVLHTVLDSPTPEQAQLLLRITDASDAVVTLTVAAQRRLVAQYRVDPSKVHLIRHGATLHQPTDSSRIVRRPLILTWGLLGPGMGIEWAIDGLHLLRHLRPLPAYIVAGQTHPRVHQEHGESYRLKLGQRARIVGVAHLFRTIGSCLDDAALTRLIHRADVVLLPYDSLDQAASAVLAEAVAAGKPVVATAFPHAVELLSSGAGLLVHHFDGTALGEALYRVLTEPGLASRMAMEAARLAPMFSWTVAANQYRSLGKSLLGDWSVLEQDSTETALRATSPAIG